MYLDIRISMCMYIHIHIHICTSIYRDLYEDNIYMYIHTPTHACIYIYIHTYKGVHAHMCACVYVCMHVCKYRCIDSEISSYLARISGSCSRLLSICKASYTHKQKRCSNLGQSPRPSASSSYDPSLSAQAFSAKWAITIAQLLKVYGP